jgi:hypothetical protein
MAFHLIIKWNFTFSSTFKESNKKARKKKKRQRSNHHNAKVSNLRFNFDSDEFSRLMEFQIPACKQTERKAIAANTSRAIKTLLITLNRYVEIAQKTMKSVLAPKKKPHKNSSKQIIF